MFQKSDNYSPFCPDNEKKPTEYMVQARRALVSYGKQKGFFENELEILTFIVGSV